MAISRIETNSIASSQTLTTPIIATTMGVGGATPSGSGSGITFPAAQSASTDQNTLDDYEEGNWTPSQGVGLVVTGSFSSGGNYTKIGRMVYLSGYVQGSTSVSVSAGSAICANLPFSAITVPQQPGAAINTNTTAGAIVLAYTTNIFAGQTISTTLGIQFNIAYQV